MALLKSTTSECRIYVGNLPQHVKDRDLEDFFDKYGNIKGVDVHSRFEPAFAFIEFEDPRDAADAVKGRDNEKFEGQRIKVQFPRNSSAGGGGDRSSYGGGRDRDRDSGPSGRGGYTRGRGRGQPIRRSEYRVLISGLPSTGSWQDLKDHMREAGEVLYADVYKDGTAVCEFASYDDMKWACKNLDDTKFKSHESESSYIRVKQDSSKKSRTRSPSPRGRSRSRSRSRNRRSRSRSRSSSASSRGRR